MVEITKAELEKKGGLSHAEVMDSVKLFEAESRGFKKHEKYDSKENKAFEDGLSQGFKRSAESLRQRLKSKTRFHLKERKEEAIA